MMRSVIACLLLACPLRYATAQVVKPLAPLVVQLVPGDVVRDRLIGMDSTTYATTADLIRAADVAVAACRHENELLRQQAAQDAADLHASRAALVQQEKDYQLQLAAGRKVASKPLAKPLLLDPHTYAGVAAGVVATLLYLVVH